MNEHKESRFEKIKFSEIPRTNRVVVYGTKGGSAPYLTQAILDKAELLEKEIDTFYCSDSGRFQDAFFNREFDPEGNQINIDTLPSGVIVCSEIRQYDPWNGNGMTIEAFVDKDSRGLTFFDTVAQLCDPHGVPIVKNEQTVDDFRQQ